jgi:Flp pilus assembly secretin CpaC
LPASRYQQAATKTQEVSVPTAGIAALPFSQKVTCFAVEDSSICQIVATRVDELRVLGQQEGQTRIAVWLGPRESTTPQIFQIEVTASETVDETTLALAANKLNHSLTQTFPDVQVRVIAGDGKLTVHGTAQGDETARRILRLVRQACLVPVIDKITVR